MLPVKNRLKKGEDFQRVIRAGSFFSFGNLSIKAVKNKLPHSRIGFIVRKKGTKSAVKRNNIKRQLRSHFFNKLKLIFPGYDIIVYYDSVSEKEKKRIDDNKVDKLLLKSGLIKKR